MQKLILQKTLVQFLLNIFQFFQGIFPFAALIYILTWCFKVMGLGIYEKLNAIFGLVPNILDTMFKVEYDIAGSTVSLGYVFASLICALLFLITNKICSKLNRKMDEIEFLIKTKVRRDEKIVHSKKELQTIKKNISIKDYYGLFEIKMKFLSKDNTDKQLKLEQMKLHYSKMISDKLKLKYEHMRFATTNKLFFKSNNFKELEFFIEDVLKLYQPIYDINKEHNIQTKLSFILWVDNCDRNSREIYNILLNINKTNVDDKIIVNDVISAKYTQISQRKYTPISLGTSKIFIDNYNDIDVELFYLKK